MVEWFKERWFYWWWYWNINNKDGVPVFKITHLLHLCGCRIDLHKVVKVDDEGWFHSHPAWAVRIILWGGYEEEVLDQAFDCTYRVVWWPGRVGIVRPELTHRFNYLLNGRSSYSLWLRGPCNYDVDLTRRK